MKANLRFPSAICVSILTGLVSAAGVSAQTLFTPGGTVGVSNTSGVGVGTSSPLAGSLQISYNGDVFVRLAPNSGANNRESIVDFWSTFDNHPDNGVRRTAIIRAGFDGGVWGSEFLSFHVGGSDDAQTHPVERMRLRPGHGGSLKIRITNPAYMDDYFGLQAGGPIETRVEDASSWIRFHDPADSYYSAGYNRADRNFRINYGAYPGETTDFVMDSLGRVGLGASNPGAQLDVLSPDFLISRFFGSSAGNHAVQVNNSVFSLNVGIAANPATAGVGYLWSSSGKFMIGSDGAPTLMVDGMSNGKVGIGTTTPSHTLSVNGVIKTKEVIVETSGWSDHVFADDYPLASLSEIEAHIDEAGHLPGIPSANEVAEHGVSVGKMQAKLLEKIEELTLHLIEQEKTMKALEGRNLALEGRVREIEGL
ncbi:MAG: hypothetical protein ACREIA_05690 [Opitutaceae bacterium]